VLTGLVIDFSIFSLYCQSCAYATTRYGGRDTRDFKAWQETHEGCNCNYSGSSGGMEVEAAEMLWGRSVDRLKFRYTTIRSDGDSRTYKRLCDLQPYGPDVTIEKEECVKHFAKRMGTAHNKLASEGKKAGITLGGCSHARLTQNTIKNLTRYYGRTIRTHPGDLDAMRRAVFATFFHSLSTNEEPHHNHCPPGRDSWCFFQRALAIGDKPGAHIDKVGTPLSKEVAEKVKDVYVRLGHPELLQRCCKVRTQNPNESLHSVVWKKCPKTGFIGLTRVLAATNSTRGSSQPWLAPSTLWA